MAATVTFAEGSAVIDEAGKKMLDAIAPCLKNSHYVVAGFTDNLASPRINDPLSLHRAMAVRAYLISKGDSANDLSAKGYGDRDPVASNATADGRAKNRRIEFHRT
jgi:outer membrane protein OmpA-like peptidoglycan-associated protein